MIGRDTPATGVCAETVALPDETFVGVAVGKPPRALPVLFVGVGVPPTADTPPNPTSAGVGVVPAPDKTVIIEEFVEATMSAVASPIP